MRSLLMVAGCVLLGWSFAMLFRSCQLTEKVSRDTKRDLEWGERVRGRVDDYMQQQQAPKVAAHDAQ
jgi:hypothetical protein